MTRTLRTTLLAGAMTLGLTGAAHAQIAYSLADDGGSLVGFAPNANDDGFGDGVDIIAADGTALALEAITYRPQTGELYGYDAQTGSLYTIELGSGRAVMQFRSDLLPDGFVSFDTNPNLDAFRFITASGENVVYFPDDTANTGGNAGRVISVEIPDEAGNISPLTYADGYDEDGTPQLLGNGYTNQLPLDDAQTQDDDLLQYVLDAGTNTLGILDNNAGTVDFVAEAGFDFDLAGGFDVFTDGDADLGYALLSVDGDQALYSIDLVSFVFRVALDIDDDLELTSLAVFTPGMHMDVIPVPAAAFLFPLGAAGIAAARRRKAKA